MMGRPEEPEMKGLIPRSVEQIFEVSQTLLSQGWKYKMQVCIQLDFNVVALALSSITLIRFIYKIPFYLCHSTGINVGNI